MEDKIKELTSDLSRLQIRNEVLKDEYDNNEKKIEILANKLNELLEVTQDNKKN